MIRHNRKYLFALLAALSLILTPSGILKSEELVTDLSDHLVAIKSSFTGTDLLLFGAVETDSAAIRALPRDIVVVVRGPNERLMVRYKQRRAGIWVNTRAMDFAKVPSYYAAISTRPLDLIAENAILKRHQIGLANLKFDTRSRVGVRAAIMPDQEAFRRSVIRLKAKDKLYREVGDGVAFLGDTLFRAKISLPANVQSGYYTAEVFLFRNGKVLHAQSSPLYINKSGFERYVYNLSRRRPTLYGILAVMFALLAGWMASVLLRRR